MVENSIEEDITKINTYIELVLEKDYCNCNELNTILGKHCDGSKNVAYAMQHILSEYKKVLKENEELRAKWDKDTHILQNKLDYANADRIDLAQQNKELRKENEELNNRCRNLDTEAQAYLEELAGDNTLTRRTIKQLQEENEELKEKENKIYKEVQENLHFEKFLIVKERKPDLFNQGRFYISQIIYDILNDVQNPEGIHKENKCIQYIDYIPVQKVKDNIKKLEIKKEKARGERNILERFAIEKSINNLQELLYGRNK